MMWSTVRSNIIHFPFSMFMCYFGAAQEVTSGPFRDISDYYYQNAVTGECGGGSCPITNKGINKEYLELMGYYPSDSYCVERQVQSIAGVC